MTGLMWGMAGAAIVDVLLIVVAIGTLPRLLKAAMRKQFGKTPAGSNFPPIRTGRQ